METFLDLIQALQSDLNVDDNSTLYPLARIKSALNRSYYKGGALFRWPGLESAKKTSTELDNEYYDYPTDFRPNSIYRISIDGKRFGDDPDGGPIDFKDFLIFKEDEPNSTKKRWANHKDKYFISPASSAVGEDNLCVWGYTNVETLVDDSDETIWSLSEPELNEAIVLEATAILKRKGKKPEDGLFYSAESRAIFMLAWSRIAEDRAKYDKDQPRFHVPNYFPSGRRVVRSKIGNFF